MINKNTMLLPIRLFMTLYFLTFCISCQSDVIFTVEDGSGPPLSTENTVTVTLDNPSIEIRGVQMDICDEGDYLTCTGCETTERTPDFFCITNELPDGCCRMILVSLTGDSIEAGTRPIFTLSYDVSEEAPVGECKDLNLESVTIVDEDMQPLDIRSLSIPGEFCFEDNAEEDEI